MKSLSAVANSDVRVRTEGLTLFAWTTAILLMIGFWFTDHSWDQSIYYAGMDEATYTGAENATVDHLSAVNANSSIARISLAAWGLLCIFLPRLNRLRFNSSLGMAMVALTAIVFSSLLWSDKPMHTLFKLVVLGTLGITAIGIASQFTLKQFLKMVAVVCVGYVVFGVFAELAHGTFRPTGDYRFIGTSHPNTQAIYGAMLCIVARLLWYEPRFGTLLAVGIFALGLGVIVLTKSRTTLGAVAVAMLAIQVLSVRGSNRIALLAGGSFVIGCGAIGATMLSQKAVGTVGSFAAMGREENISSLTGRLPLWEELGTSIQKSPFLGHGYLAYWDADRVEYLSDIFKWEIPHGHNMYLDTLLDVGFIGLGALVICLLSGMIRAVREYSKSGDIEYAAIFGLCICAIINGLAESLFKLPGLPLFVMVTCFLGMLRDRRIDPLIAPKNVAYGSL